MSNTDSPVAAPATKTRSKRATPPATPAIDTAPRFIKIGADNTQLPHEAVGHVAVLDTRTGLVWAVEPLTRKPMPHKKAEKAVAELQLLGMTDWRLPTVEELFALADRSRRAPAIDVDFFPDTPLDWFWTSTPAAWSPSGYAWIVDFDNGNANSLHRDYDAFVRAVRSVGASPGQ
jgi:hypothetical protein